MSTTQPPQSQQQPKAQEKPKSMKRKMDILFKNKSLVSMWSGLNANYYQISGENQLLLLNGFGEAEELYHYARRVLGVSEARFSPMYHNRTKGKDFDGFVYKNKDGKGQLAVGKAKKLVSPKLPILYAEANHLSMMTGKPAKYVVDLDAYYLYVEDEADYANVLNWLSKVEMGLKLIDTTEYGYPAKEEKAKKPQRQEQGQQGQDGQQQQQQQQGRNIAQLVLANNNLSTLATILSQQGIEPVVQALSGTGPFTVFAPNNAAFANVDLTGLNTQQVITILQNHVVQGTLNSQALQGLAGQTITTLGGQQLAVAVNNGVLTVGGAVIDTNNANIAAGNGLVHVAQSVLQTA